MPAVITLTFSPCIDKSTTVSSLIPEKKLKCSAPKLEPGGGGINVARAIKKLGGDAIAVFPSGGYTGKFFNHLVEKEGVASIIVETETETRENIIVLEESTNNQYRFGMPAGALQENEWKSCVEAIEKTDSEFIVVSGSMPPGVPLTVFDQLAAIAKYKKAKLIVDTSGNALKHVVTSGVYLIKPNLGELASLAGIERVELNKVEEISKEIIRKYKCEVVVVSLGREGAMLVTKDAKYNAIPPEVERKSTVGAGDSMVAGIIYSLSKGMDLKNALQYGVACGTAATMNAGTELCNKRDADFLYSLISK